MLLKRTSLIIFLCYNFSINSISLMSLIAGIPMVHTMMCHLSSSFEDYKAFDYPFTEQKVGPNCFTKHIMYLMNGKINSNELRSFFNVICLICNSYFLCNAYKTSASSTHKIYTFCAFMFHFVQLTTMPVETKPLNISSTE